MGSRSVDVLAKAQLFFAGCCQLNGECVGRKTEAQSFCNSFGQLVLKVVGIIHAAGALFIASPGLAKEPIRASPQKQTTPKREFVPPADHVSLGAIDFKPPLMEVALDCGTVPLSRATTFSVIVKNTTNADLKIEKVESSCGCLAATPSSRKIGASDQEKVFLVFTPKSQGNAGRTNSIYFDNGKSLLLKLAVKVKPLFSVKRDVIALSRAKPTFNLEFSTNFPDLASIRQITSHNDLVSVIQPAAAEFTKVSFDATKFVASDEPTLSLALSITDDSGQLHRLSLLLSRSDRLRVTPSVLAERNRVDATASARAFVRGSAELIEAVATEELSLQVVDKDANRVEGVEVSIASVRPFGEGALMVDLAAKHKLAKPKVVWIRWYLGSQNIELARTPIRLLGRPVAGR